MLKMLKMLNSLKPINWIKGINWIKRINWIKKLNWIKDQHEHMDEVSAFGAGFVALVSPFSSRLCCGSSAA